MSNPRIEWKEREEFKPFGHRLDFLSPEQKHLQTGTLAILPPMNKEKRKRDVREVEN